MRLTNHKYRTTNSTIMFVVFVLVCILNYVDGSVKCPSSVGTPDTTVHGSIFKFGDPVMFVTTQSQRYSPYSLVDVHRKTSVLEEYLMVGYMTHDLHDHRDHLKLEHLTMLVYDGGRNVKTKASDRPDLVHQNLEKELYWRFFNSTGIYPSVTIVNSTTRVTIDFHVHKHLHNQPTDIAFYTALSTRELFREPQVPYMAIFELPANTRVLRQTKTMIQYQSFSLWRWKLSDTVMDWSNITSISDPTESSTALSNFQRIDNPCIRDMFLLYVPRQLKNGGDGLVYLASPLIQSHLDENWFYDMKTPDHPWWPDVPETIVLTNDHLVVMTENSMWISDSLNDSTNLDIDLEMRGTYEDRPILTYHLANPCERFGDSVDCFVSENTVNKANVTISTSQRLFYTPVCYLNQFPFYDDTLIFTVERNTTYADGEEIIDFSVLYAPSPYRERDWRVLFSNVVYYKLFQQSGDGVTHMKRHVFIKRIVGIFFNHHLRQFDITLELNYTSPKYVRFVLPEPATVFDGYGDLLSRMDKMKAHARNDHRKKLRQLNGTVGNGFLQFEFPRNFEIDNVLVNGENLDVFFVGNQLWIAEGAGPFVYVSMAGFNHLQNDTLCIPQAGSTSKIKQCSFNHPDKAYVCTNEDQRLIFAGKIGIKYRPTAARVDEIVELANAQRVNPWVTKYFCELVQNRGVFVAGYSGRILFWYLHEPMDESSALQQALSSGCTQPEKEPILCDDIQDWQSRGCTAEPLGKPRFRLVAIDASRIKPVKRNTDGPLVPFLVDSNTAILYEGIFPAPEDDPNNTLTYFRDVHLGQMIMCLDYELQKADAKDVSLRHNCQLFIRHMKPVDNFLDGFRSILFVTILKSIPLLPLPADIVVLVQAHSNMALVKINDYLNDPPWDFKDDHIGQTLYIPGNFSMLLTSFPFENDKTVMEGYATRYFQFEQRYIFRAFYIFLMDMSTKRYRETQLSQALDVINRTKSRWSEIDKRRSDELQAEIDMRQRIEERWKQSMFAEVDANGIVPVFKNPPPVIDSRENIENKLLKLTVNETINIAGMPHAWVPRQPPSPDSLVHGHVPYKDKIIWHVLETQCHYVMSLVHNPVLKTSGGRISLDIYDQISFEVLLRPVTSLAALLMYRPLIEVTNTNPDVLRVEKIEKLKGAPQFFQLLLTPTGFRKGVAVITVRSMVTSVHCAHSSSVTFIILCHRDVGRRLHVEYPIPSCKPKEEEGMYPRPWYTQVEGCIRKEEILDSSKQEIVREIDERKLTAYITLPTNYRPPSFDGAHVPNTRNVYNADPSKPAYNTWYKISRETLEYNRCEGKKTKEDCNCSPLDRLLDDEELTECKEKVFATKRTGTNEPIIMVISYDRIMQDSDQNPEIFLPKRNWSVTIEEVNGRGEWYILSEYTPYINMINTNTKLHRGRRHYDMNKLYITLLGTGLFHFKVKLGPFESFSDVTGYFMLYARTDDINHVHLFMILLGTIIFCLTCVFIGFMANRKRLSSMLPIQPMSHKRKLKHFKGQSERTILPFLSTYAFPAIVNI